MKGLAIMVGQVWSVAAEGGFLYSDELSDTIRVQVQPLTKFRQLCDMPDGDDKGLHAGASFVWNVFSNIGAQGRRLAENQPIPQSGFTIQQRSLTMFEAGNSVPYTGKLSDLAKQSIVDIIDKTLKEDARKYFDIESYLQFRTTPLRVSPTSGTSTTSVDLSTNGSAATANNVEFGKGHVKAVVDLMKERNIPPFAADDYVAISHPTTYRTFKNDLETIVQYTDVGINHIFNGEIGRYEGTRFIEQTFIPKGGANNATTYDPWTGTAQAWSNNKSSWAFFLGADTCTEGVGIPEEIRASIPGDFGRSKALAWYYLGGFGLGHPDALNARIVMWDSTT
jgi:N4-gp56 family major capsid protein